MPAYMYSPGDTPATIAHHAFQGARAYTSIIIPAPSTTTLQTGGCALRSARR